MTRSPTSMEVPVVDDRPALSGRAMTVIQHLLKAPDDEHTAADIARATGIPPVTVGPILSRLASYEWVIQKPGRGAARPYRFTDDGLTAARESVREATRRVASRADDRVVTMGELKAAVEQGQEDPGVYAAVRRELNRQRGQ